MSIIAKNISTALTEREQGQGICLNQVLPGNLLSHSYNEVWLHTESVYISCDDNGYFEKLSKDSARGRLSKRFLIVSS